MSHKLPLFDPETVVWSRASYYSRETQTTDSFVRTVRLTSISHKIALLDLLSLADRHMNEICRRVGGVAVPHVWGLIRQEQAPLTPHQRQLRTHPDTPGYLLAAEVETIKHPQRLTGYEQLRAYEETLSYKMTAFDQALDETFMLNDIGPRQFSIGTTASVSSEHVILHDIEPLMIRRK